MIQPENIYSIDSWYVIELYGFFAGIGALLIIIRNKGRGLSFATIYNNVSGKTSEYADECVFYGIACCIGSWGLNYKIPLSIKRKTESNSITEIMAGGTDLVQITRYHMFE